MTEYELFQLNAAAYAFFSRWAPRCMAHGFAINARLKELSMSSSGIATALFRNPVTKRVEVWGVDLDVWRQKRRITPKLLRA